MESLLVFGAGLLVGAAIGIVFYTFFVVGSMKERETQAFMRGLRKCLEREGREDAFTWDGKPVAWKK